jgi:hypothetical protein
MSVGEQTGALVVSAASFAAHCQASEVLVSKSGKPALLGHADAHGQPLMTKVWHRSGLFTSDRIVPYHRRFRRALQTLPQRGVAVPRYLAHGRVADGHEHFVIYEPLQGTPLRSCYAALDLGTLAAFVRDLHDRGVYFRGLHLGNVIRCADGSLGLIDVQDIRLFRRSLSRRRRERNLGILCSHPGDLAYMLDGHWSELVLAYCRAAGWSVAGAARMRERVRVQIERRRARRAARRIRRGLEPLRVGEYPAGDTAARVCEDPARPPS